jgi:hypothetical protein
MLQERGLKRVPNPPAMITAFMNPLLLSSRSP